MYCIKIIKKLQYEVAPHRGDLGCHMQLDVAVEGLCVGVPMLTESRVPEINSVAVGDYYA